MTGNELAMPFTTASPLRIEDIWRERFRVIEQEAAPLRQRVRAMESEIETLTTSRERMLAFQLELCALLGLPYPDPARMLRAVREHRREGQP